MKTTGYVLAGIVCSTLACSEETPMAFDFTGKSVNLMVDPPTTLGDDQTQTADAVAADDYDPDVDAIFDSIEEDAVGGVTDDGESDDLSEWEADSGSDSGSGPDADGSDRTAKDSTGKPGRGNSKDDGSGASDGEFAQPNGSEMAACAELQGVPAKSIKVVGNQNSLRLETDSVIAVKLAGNQSKLELTLSGADAARIAGVCLFVTGNEGHAVIHNQLEVSRFIYVGRGNLSHTEFVAAPGSKVVSMNADLSGNSAKLTMSGEGAYPCQTVRMRGNDPQFVCE